MTSAVKAFLQSTVEKLSAVLGESASYAKLMNTPKLKDAFYFEANDLSAPVAATFEWHE
jgi:hypothetical protein